MKALKKNHGRGQFSLHGGELGRGRPRPDDEIILDLVGVPPPEDLRERVREVESLDLLQAGGGRDLLAQALDEFRRSVVGRGGRDLPVGPPHAQLLARLDLSVPHRSAVDEDGSTRTRCGT